jgi:hypothetical protein
MIGNQAESEIFTAAATWGSSTFHNLFHKARHALLGRRRPEKVSYSFNNCGKSCSYSKVTKLLVRWNSDGPQSAQNRDRKEE